MLIILLNWIFIFFITYIAGFAGLSGLSRIFKTHFNQVIHPTLISLTGLALVTAIANYSSLFFRINLEFITAITIITAVLFWIHHRSIFSRLPKLKIQTIHPLTLIFAAAFIIIALIKSAGSTEVWDEGQYFLPLIRWIETYPAIPGTALFHDRMGYNSAFHLSSAVFSHTYWFKGGLYDLNGYLFVIINLYFLSGINRILKNQSKHQLQNYLMLFACIALYRQLLTSIDADYSHIFIGIVLLLLLLKKSDNGSLKKWDMYSLIFVLLTLYLVTVKFLAIYFLLPVGIFLFYLWQQKQFRTILLILLLGIIYIFPWLARNVILTGYLVYPVYIFDFFDVDWKIPLSIAKNNYLYVSEHAKTLVERHSLYYDGASNIPLNLWLPGWWSSHADINISAVLTGILLPPSLFTLAVLLMVKWKKTVIDNPGYLLAIGTAMIFLIFWFLKYPSVRFGWAWILFILIFTFIQFNKNFVRIPQRTIRRVSVILLTIALFRGTNKTIEESDNLQSQLVFPHTVNKLNNYSKKKIGIFDITVSDDMNCWGQPPPCMPNYYDELNIIPRGSKFTDGFKLQK